MNKTLLYLFNVFCNINVIHTTNQWVNNNLRSTGWLYTLMSLNASFAAERMYAAKLSQLGIYMFSLFGQLRPSARCRQVLFSTTETRIYAGVLCWCRRAVALSSLTEAHVHFSRRRPPTMTAPRIFLYKNFSLTGTVILLVLRHFSRTTTNSFQYKTTSLVLISTFIGSLLQKPPSSAMSYAGWIHCRDVTRHGLLVMHVVFRFLLRIFA